MAAHFANRAIHRLLSMVAASVVIASGAGPLFAQQPKPEPRGTDRKDGEEDEIERRHEWFFSTRRAGTESEKDLARLRRSGVEATRSALEAQRLRRPIGLKSAQSSWVSMGPSPSTFGGWDFGNISGRITSLAADWAGGVLYAASASGGLWKSTDDGISWTHVFETAGTQTVGTVAIDPNDPNVIWAGTGENIYGCENYFGIGLLRSGDGGLTWETRNGTGSDTLDELASFANVIVDPRNSNSIVTGGQWRGCSAGSQQVGGLYTTVDGGLTWVRRLADTAIYEIARDPAVLDVLWAGTNRGVYKSVDNGVSWTLQTSSGLPHGNVGRTELAIAPSNGNVVYAILGGASLWRTTNGGATWTQMATGFDACDGQCWYNMVLRVHRTNPNIVYRGTIHIFKSVDAGATWTDLSNEWGGSQKVHQDTHELLMDPDDPNTFYVGCDGGVWKSTDGGASFLNRNGNLNVTQFYAVGVQADDPGVICGGAQDNSSLARTTSNVWSLQEVTGDGFVCHIDPLDPSHAYIASYPSSGYPAIYGSTTGLLGSFSLITWSGSGINSGDRSNWVTPYLLDPISPHILYLGTHRVYRSDDHGTSWKPVGPPDLTGGSGDLISLEINRNYPRFLFSGSTSGKVWRTLNSGMDWVDITTGLPERSINDIASDPTNPDRAFAVVGGFNTSHLWEWTAAAGWVARGSELPNVPANTVLMLTDRDLLVGTDTGIFRSTDGGVSFEPYMDGLPEGLVVTDLKYSPLQSVVTAGTYGRGAWQIGVEIALPPVVLYASVEQPLVQVTGDGDGKVERGETWTVRPVLRNNGSTSALGVEARLETSSRGVTLVDNGPRPYGDVLPGATAASSYRFAVDPSSCSSEIAFDVVDITSTNAPGNYPDAPAAFTVSAVCPDLRYDSFSSLIEVEGNANGGIDPGETWELIVNLRNDGSEAAAGVGADLVSDPASPVSVTLLQGGSTYSDIGVGGVAPSIQAYRFRVDSAAPCGEWISLSVAARSTVPANVYSTEVGVIRLLVGGTGPEETVFYENFESPTEGWSTGQPNEWQIDIPQGLGGPMPDPTVGYDGPHVLGTDLTGLGLVPGNYENNSPWFNWWYGSPNIHFPSAYHRIRVSYARWLNVSAGDSATLEMQWFHRGAVEGRGLYSSSDAADSSWTTDSFDISDIADDLDWVFFVFRIQSDAQQTASGWNIDAFEVRGVPLDSCEPYVPLGLRYDSYAGLTEIDGNGNATVDPGETWEMHVRLRNDGAAPVGGVSADLTIDSSTSGSVVLLQDSSSYGSIAPGQVVPSLAAYRFRVGDDFPCGGEVVLSVTGIISTNPAGSYPDELAVIRIPVGASVMLFEDNFETNKGWQRPAPALDEWQLAVPRGLGAPDPDPVTGYDGPTVMGTDQTGFGLELGNYPTNRLAQVRTPDILIPAGVVATELEYARWLNVGPGDYGRVGVAVSGGGKWFPDLVTKGVSSWTIDTLDIRDVAAGKDRLVVWFTLNSDAQGTNSGWNIDAFKVRGRTCEPFARALPGEASNLRVSKGGPGPWGQPRLTLQWDADCGGATTYAIYRGDLRVGYSSIAAEPDGCDVPGTTASIPLGDGDAEFFLVVPYMNGEEGSYGRGAFGAPRSPAANACYPQGAMDTCAP